MIDSSQVWFGNQSGVMLGFDWNDSLRYDPSFNPTTKTLSYTVGPSFAIDPVTAASNSNDRATDVEFEQHVFYANSYWWLFYYDGTNYDYVSSPNGTTWSSPTIITTSGFKEDYGIAIWVSGDEVYYADEKPDTWAQVVYNSGTLGKGTISWNTESLLTTDHNDCDCGSLSIVTDSNGNLWIAAITCESSGCPQNSIIYTEIWELTSSGWTYNTPSGLASQSGQYVQLVPLTGGKMAVVAYTGNPEVWTYSGTSWNSGVTDSAIWDEYGVFGSSATAIGNTVEFAAEAATWSSPPSTAGIYYLSYAYGASSWSSAAQISSSEGPATISSDGSSTLVISYFPSTSTLDYIISRDSGLDWSSPGTISSSESLSSLGVSSSYSITAGFFEDVWTSGTSSPYNVRFAALPVTVPTAATSANSWSKPGVSPYESYFQNLNEYVSPGNGLLSIGQTDLSIAGRGVDLNITRIFSTPYGFRSTSPYLYDNYTLTNLGYGWSLNFPWMGTNYLHLTDGQAYPYQWSGNTFQYNKATNFELINNTSSYSLYLPDGTVYTFNSAKQLTTETDNTGNNTIDFTYGSNGYISYITDTIGRTVTFSYNSNNTLSSISGGGETVYYTYHGHDLSSVKDAVGDLTYYQYNTGINRLADKRRHLSHRRPIDLHLCERTRWN